MGGNKKTQTILTILLCVSIILPGFLINSTTTKGESQYLFSNQLMTLDVNALPVLNSDFGDLTADGISSLPTLSPWWCDLANKELVANDVDGVYIAIIDSGISSIWSDLLPEANIAWEYAKGFTHDVTWDNSIGAFSFGPLRDDRGPITGYGSDHGTAVASMITGYNFNNLFTVDGMAPGATIIPVLVFDAWLVDSPYGPLPVEGATWEMILSGIYYIANLADELDGPIIMNLSFGAGVPLSFMEEAIDYAISKGVIVVASAGNGGDAGMSYPAAYDQVISVAACGWTPLLAQSWGTNLLDSIIVDVPETLNTPDILGNEYQVYLAPYSSRPNADSDQKDQYLDVMGIADKAFLPYKPSFGPHMFVFIYGTSISSPYVCAITALILQQYPMFTQKDIEHILLNAAHGVGLNNARGFPKIGVDVKVADMTPGTYYTVSWYLDDFGKGLLLCDFAMNSAADYYAEKFP